MKINLAVLFFLFISFSSFSQEETEEGEGTSTTSTGSETSAFEDEEYVSTKEIGFDVNFGASNLAGTVGLGLKLGFLKGEKYIFGPSLRYQYSWQNFNGIRTNYSIYGGGVFGHVRLYNYFFLGTEIEFLSSPIQNGFYSPIRKFVPVVLIGGGFSKSFGPNFRLNAGIMYDLINDVNSPLRAGYFVRNNLGILQPIIYRIAFFIPL